MALKLNENQTLFFPLFFERGKFIMDSLLAFSLSKTELCFLFCIQMGFLILA